MSWRKISKKRDEFEDEVSLSDMVEVVLGVLGQVALALILAWWFAMEGFLK